MKSLVKNVLVCGSLLLALTGCSEEKKDSVVITANQQMDSQELANAGEQLMMPQSLHLAYRVFEMSLQKDPDNKKAQFYKSFLERVMVFEGILTRLQPYVDKYGNKEQFNKMIKDFPNSSLRNFLLREKKDAPQITNLSDIQNVLVEYRLAAEKLRTFIMQNQDANIELFLNPYLFSAQINENIGQSCELTEDSSQDDFKVVCDMSDVATIRVNTADLMALKQIAAGEVAYSAIFTSYSVGSIDNILKGSLAGKSSKEIMDTLENVKDTGILMKKQGLTALRNLGSDLAVGLKWAMQHQDNLCRRDEQGHAIARKGFLVKDLCIENMEGTKQSLALLESALRGAIQIPVEVENGNTVTTAVNYFALVDAPALNLRTLLPKSWNATGDKATSFRDSSLGGTFPNRDAEVILRKSN